MKYLEPYAKEKNTLQLSLFYFGKGRPEHSLTKWEDSDGKYQLKCDCCYGVPGSFEQDVYTATMRLWIKQNRPKDGIRLNYSDIARELRLEPAKHYVGQIKEALIKLAHARYEFNQCFIQVEEGQPIKIDTHFSLYDSASLFTFEKNQGKSKRNGQSKLFFPQEIQKNLEAKYYQLLDMVWYRRLPEGLPRRLYEFLEKRRYHNINGKFSISEEALCRWLPITTRNATERRKTLDHTAKALITSGYLLSYEFEKSSRICTFTYAKKGSDVEIKGLENLTAEPGKVLEAVGENLEALTPIGTESPREAPKIYLEAMTWLNTIPYFHERRKQEIASLPFADIERGFLGIKAEYDRQSKAGKPPKAGWVYKAFMEGWNFSTTTGERKTERQISDEKKQSRVEEAFARLSQERQEEIKRKFQEAYKDEPEMLKNKWVWVKFIENFKG